MAMRVAKSTNGKNPVIIPTSAGLFQVSQSVGELNLLSKAVNDVDFSKPVTRREHHKCTSKQKPKAMNRVKPVPKAKPKPQATSKPKSPPAPTKTVAVEANKFRQDESLEYGMWLEFHDDLSSRMKIYPYPPSNKDKMEGEKRMRNSQRSKKGMENVRALGITPRAHKNRPVPMHVTDFSTVRNSDYQQELIDRYCALASIARTYPHVFGHLDHIANVTPVAVPKPVVQSVNAKAKVIDVTVSSANDEGVIEAFERIVETDKQTAKVEAVTVEQARYDDKVRSLEFKLYEEYLDMPAANDDHCEESNPPMMSYNPWSQAVSLSYRKTVRSYEQKQGRAEGSRYLRWLAKHSSSIHLRETTERARQRTMPEYEMKLGTQVHTLYHHSRKAYDNLVRFMQHRRIAAFDMGEMTRSTYGQWIKAIESMPVTSVIDKWLEDIDNTEKLAEKIVDQAVSRKEGMAASGNERISFSEWNKAYAMYHEHINGLTPRNKDDVFGVHRMDATSTGSSPTVNQSTAEIVSLESVRLKRKTGFATLLAKIKGPLRKQIEGLVDDLSIEDKKSLIAYLKASC